MCKRAFLAVVLSVVMIFQMASPVTYADEVLSMDELSDDKAVDGDTTVEEDQLQPTEDRSTFCGRKCKDFALDDGCYEENVDGLVSMSETEYESKINSFVNDNRWKDGASYYNGKPGIPYVSTHSSTGCFAYACDFTKYVYGIEKYESGEKYTSVSQIRTGDVVEITNHTFVVLKRDGDTLYTAEGAWGNSVARVGTGNYKFNGTNNSIFAVDVGNITFNRGFHFLDLTAGSSPIGDLNDVSGGRNSVYVRGWAYDPDDTSANLNIHIYIDDMQGNNVYSNGLLIANSKREDVNEVYGSGNYHGFEYTYEGLDLDGEYTVRLYALDVTGNPHLFLGSKTVTIKKGHSPIGDINDVSGGLNSVYVRGWAYDPDDTSAKLNIHIYIDDKQGNNVYSNGLLIADSKREDVNEVYGSGDYHGFEYTYNELGLQGEYSVRLYALDVTGDAHSFLGSKTVTIEKRKDDSSSSNTNIRSSSSVKDDSSSSENNDKSSSSRRISSSSSSVKDSSASSEKKDNSSSSRKTGSSSSSVKDSSASSEKKDNSSSGRKTDSSSSDAKGEHSSSEKNDESSSSGKDNLSSSSKGDTSSSSRDWTQDDGVDTSLMEKVTKSAGTTFFVGDSLIVDLIGIDPEDIRMKGSAGNYMVVTDSISGKRVGVVTAMKKGTVKLYTFEGRKKTVCVLKAEQPKLKSSFNVKMGKTKKLKLSGTKMKPDSWISSDPQTVSVTSDGIVMANKTGMAIVTAIIGKHSYHCSVNVR